MLDELRADAHDIADIAEVDGRVAPTADDDRRPPSSLHEPSADPRETDRVDPRRQRGRDEINVHLPSEHLLHHLQRRRVSDPPPADLARRHAEARLKIAGLGPTTVTDDEAPPIRDQ